MRIRIPAALVALTAIGALSSAPADARHYSHGGSFVLACENGGQYRLDSGPVTVSGDVITGYLTLAPHRQIHVRLIPMGVGYRYAGRGVWIDGIRNQALLYLRKHQPIACSVTAA